jgi:hypothetical protein
VSTRWATYASWGPWKWGLMIAIADSGLGGLGLAIALVPSGSNPADPLIGYPAAVLGPLAFTAVSSWAAYGSLTRLGVSQNGLILEFPKTKLEVPWHDLLPPKLGQTKTGYIFEFAWRDSAGKRRTFVVDPVSAKYILGQPSCPRWRLPEKFTRELEIWQRAPWSDVQVRIES